MKRYDAWSESDPQCNFGGGRCELYERTLGQYVTFDDHERAIAAVIADYDRLAAENAELKRRLEKVVKMLETETHSHGEGMFLVHGERLVGSKRIYLQAVAIAEGRDNG